MQPIVQDVEIIEVAPRDGLQNQSPIIKTAQKIELIERLISAGARRIEVASFVNRSRVPQMADAEAILEGTRERSGVTRIGLVLNERGLERAIATSLEEVGVVVVASDTFGIRNQNQTAAESLAMASRVISKAKFSGKRAQATIAVAFGCPYEGAIPISKVAAMARALADSGAQEIALADTIGVAVPWQVYNAIRAVHESVSDVPLRCHFHNTRGSGIANAWAAIQSGISRLDASAGGIGGCPFAPNSTGNIASEDVVYLLDQSQIRTGYKLDELIALAPWLANLVGLERLPAMVSRAGRAFSLENQVPNQSGGQT